MMQYKGYFGDVELDPDAGIFHGEVFGIRDVVTFQGKSVDELEKAFRESVDDYLDFCRQRGEKPEKPFSGQFLLRIKPELHQRLSMLAQVSGKSLNAVAAEYLGRQADREFSQLSPLKQAGRRGFVDPMKFRSTRRHHATKATKK